MRDLSERPLVCVTLALGAGIALAGSVGAWWAFWAVGLALGTVVLGFRRFARLLPCHGRDPFVRYMPKRILTYYATLS